jgi:hypothetical protein
MGFEKLLPLTLLIIQALASMPYWAVGDWRKGLYWLFAAGLTYVVTF